MKKYEPSSGRRPRIARAIGYSQRLGFVTTAARYGCSNRSIDNKTGHRWMVVLRWYIRRANVLEENAAVTIAGP